jgi:hypothetical protein
MNRMMMRIGAVCALRVFLNGNGQTTHLPLFHNLRLTVTGAIAVIDVIGLGSFRLDIMAIYTRLNLRIAQQPKSQLRELSLIDIMTYNEW